MTAGNSYRDGKVHVVRKRCATCIFRPGNLMQLPPGRRPAMVRDAIASRSAIICHSTLFGDNAVCRGFFTRHKTLPIQLAEELGIVEEVDIP